jgi:hypothetical protein
VVAAATVDGARSECLDDGTDGAAEAHRRVRVTDGRTAAGLALSQDGLPTRKPQKMRGKAQR